MAPQSAAPSTGSQKSRAAVYLRVSTEHQKYSLSRQAAELNAYAAEHGLNIVKRYVDEGRSGRTLQARPALIEMLQTIVQGQAEFCEVLVYDVSRWGRFEDLDEASHYEFLCRQAGVQIRYCNEDFENGGTPASFIFKTLKRVAAAEFSRQLSRDIHSAMRTNSELGFRSGGRAEFGLARALVTPGKLERTILHPTERKACSSQKVMHALGPPAELRCVKRMFGYAIRRRGTAWIARKLNQENVLMRGKPWTAARVRSVLTNELFTGSLVWGRHSRKLAGPRPKSEWVVVPNVLPSLISQATFQKVQNLLFPVRRMSDQLLLTKLRRLLSRTGALTQAKINRSASVPGSSTYRHRFGSLQRAYEMIHYKPPPEQVSHLRLLRDGIAYRNEFVNRLLAMFPDRLQKLKQYVPGDRCPLVLLDGTITISIRICRQNMVGKQLKWTLGKSHSSLGDFSLLCLMDKPGKNIMTYYLYENLSDRQRIRFAADSPFLERGIRLHSLHQLPIQVSRCLQEAAMSSG